MVWFGLEGSEFRTVTISATQVLKYQAAKKTTGGILCSGWPPPPLWSGCSSNTLYFYQYTIYSNHFFSYLDSVRLTWHHILRYVRVDFLTTRILVYRSFGPEVLQLKDAFWRFALHDWREGMSYQRECRVQEYQPRRCFRASCLSERLHFKTLPEAQRTQAISQSHIS